VVSNQEPRRILLCGTVSRVEAETLAPPTWGELRSVRPYGGAVLAPAAWSARVASPATEASWTQSPTRLAA
jgi:hypothetical protein